MNAFSALEGIAYSGYHDCNMPMNTLPYLGNAISRLTVSMSIPLVQASPTIFR